MKRNRGLIMKMTKLINILIGPGIWDITNFRLSIWIILSFFEMILNVKIMLHVNIRWILIVCFLKLPLSRLFVEIYLH